MRAVARDPDEADSGVHGVDARGIHNSRISLSHRHHSTEGSPPAPSPRLSPVFSWHADAALSCGSVRRSLGGAESLVELGLDPIAEGLRLGAHLGHSAPRTRLSTLGLVLNVCFCAFWAIWMRGKYPCAWQKCRSPRWLPAVTAVSARIQPLLAHRDSPGTSEERVREC